jgi:hypothetical protein
LNPWIYFLPSEKEEMTALDISKAVLSASDYLYSSLEVNIHPYGSETLKILKMIHPHQTSFRFDFLLKSPVLE